MQVALTFYQSRVVMARIPELHAEAMREHRVPHGPKAHRYDLPAIAWRQIRDHLWLNPAYYGPMGGKLDSQPKALYRAIQLIHQAVMEMEHHPALEMDRYVVGEQPEIIPVWGWAAERSPYPVDGAPFMLMIPEIVDLHGQRMTKWKPTLPQLPPQAEGSWTYKSEPHWFFAVLAKPQVLADRNNL